MLARRLLGPSLGLSLAATSTLVRGAASLSLRGGAATDRLLLLSSGLTTSEEEGRFRRMLRDAAAGTEPCITMVVTGQMAPSNESPEGAPKKSPGEARRKRWADARKKNSALILTMPILMATASTMVKKC